MALGLPALFTLFVWWFSTGVILYLDGLPRETYRMSFAGATVVLAAALYGIALTAQQSSVAAMYGAFTCALAVWGWLEMAFLMGYIVGPHSNPCPPDSQGWRRASLAIGAILYHELALLIGIGVIVALTLRAPNQLAMWTFIVLWIGRASTKLNLFLGARNFSEQFLPPHLRYITTYFARRPMNLLFPVSVTIGSIVAVELWQSAGDADDVARGVSQSFLATLVTLAVLEHWFLIVPLRVERFWEWSMSSRRDAAVAISEKAAHDAA